MFGAVTLQVGHLPQPQKQDTMPTTPDPDDLEELAEFTSDGSMSSDEEDDLDAHTGPGILARSAPDDILVTIYRFAFDGNLHDSLAWSQVCQRWREAAVGMSALWASIASLRGTGVAKWQLRRVRPTMELSINITVLDDQSASSCDQFINDSGVLEHPGGWRNVEIRAFTYTQIAVVCARLVERSDELDKLEIELADGADTGVPQIVPLMFRPRVIRLRTAQLWMSPTLASRLEDVTFSNQMENSQTFFHSLPPNPEPILLGMLASLSLFGYPIAELLRRTFAPNLKELRLRLCHIPTGWSMKSITEFAPTLQYFEMEAEFSRTPFAEWNLLPKL